MTLLEKMNEMSQDIIETRFLLNILMLSRKLLSEEIERYYKATIHME